MMAMLPSLPLLQKELQPICLPDEMLRKDRNTIFA